MGILVVLVAGALALLMEDPPQQPVAYSHRTHITAGLKCQDCHPNPDPGGQMTFPATAKCMVCHSTIAKDKPDIQKLAAFAASKEPVPWARIYTVPAEVYWNHRSHLQAGMTCQMCHGDIAKMDVTAKATETAFMVGCIECHRQKKVSTGCEFCHEAK
ncbi:MAG TPA: cytochrome c3 family protein [Bryobacteraceae bacterium]|nr:cytochrome c3 family protein [Bryobacteraceae bacterium]